MSNVFDMLTGGVIGEVTQDGKTYATAPTPPVGDDSTKVATTAFVADKTAAIPSGNVAVWSRDFTHTHSYTNPGYTITVKAPTGGTWFCWGSYTVDARDGIAVLTSNGVVVGGRGTVVSGNNRDWWQVVSATNNMMAIKIA